MEIFFNQGLGQHAQEQKRNKMVNST